MPTVDRAFATVDAQSFARPLPRKISTMIPGVRLPRKITLRAGGVTEIVRVIDVKSNAVDDAVFELPARLRPS